MPTHHQPFSTREEAIDRLKSLYLSDVHRIAVRRFEQLSPREREKVHRDFMETEVGQSLPDEHVSKGLNLSNQPILKACLSIHLTRLWDLENYLEFDFWMKSNGLAVNELLDGGAWLFKNGRPHFIH